MSFQKASRSKSRLRMALFGPAGSGKSYTALSIAGGLPGPVAAIDTENGSLAKYADIVEFDVDNIVGDFSPAAYIRRIKEAESSGYQTLIIDSLTHAWSGKGGVKDIVDDAAAKSKSKNQFAAWRVGTPQHQGLVDAIIQSTLHIIWTMRSKTHYEAEKDEQGKVAPRRIGLAPDQREGLEYEADILGEMDNGKMHVLKARYPKLHGILVDRPDESFGRILADWLSDGPPSPVHQANGGSVAYSHLLAAISSATSLETLSQVGASVKEVSSKLDHRERDVLRQAYGDRLKALEVRQ